MKFLKMFFIKICTIALLSLLSINFVFADSDSRGSVIDRVKKASAKTKVKLGMSYKEVVEILGEPTKEKRFPGMKKNEKLYLWKQSKGQPISVNFFDDEAASISFPMK